MAHTFSTRLLGSIARYAAPKAERPNRCDHLEVIEELEADLTASRQQIQALEEQVGTLTGQLSRARAERERLARVVGDGDKVNDLLDRMDELEAKNARLVATHGTREDLLRERETNRKLADEVHRLTMASIAANRGRP
jgi:flagellar biosynthesis/type III secretory pathway chaperone